MPSVPGIRVSFRRLAAIDALAASARSRLAPDVPPDGKLNMMRVLENIDGTFACLPRGRRAKVKLDVQRLPPHILAETHVADDLVYLTMSDRTYTLLSSDEGCARFTAAHEIGHVAMHSLELGELERIGHHAAALSRATATHERAVDSEFQSNMFSAAFLAPDDGLKLLEQTGPLTTDRVMKTFGMGRKAATARIDNYRRRGGYLPRTKGGR